MARINKAGSSFCALKLTRAEENKWKRWLVSKKVSAKNHLRVLIRREIANGALNIEP